MLHIYAGWIAPRVKLRVWNYQRAIISRTTSEREARQSKNNDVFLAAKPCDAIYRRHWFEQRIQRVKLKATKSETLRNQHLYNSCISKWAQRAEPFSAARGLRRVKRLKGVDKAAVVQWILRESVGAEADVLVYNFLLIAQLSWM